MTDPDIVAMIREMTARRLEEEKQSQPPKPKISISELARIRRH